MGKQYNKLIKRRRRHAYLVRKKSTVTEAKKATAPAKGKPATKKAATPAPAAPEAAAAPKTATAQA
jgi:hypothetical protein